MTDTITPDKSNLRIFLISDETFASDVWIPQRAPNAVTALAQYAEECEITDYFPDPEENPIMSKNRIRVQVCEADTTNLDPDVCQDDLKWENLTWTTIKSSRGYKQNRNSHICLDLKPAVDAEPVLCGWLEWDDTDNQPIFYKDNEIQHHSAPAIASSM